MPGPIIANPLPDWLKSENASVLDSPWKATLRSLADLAGYIGLDPRDPQGQILAFMAPLEAPMKGTLQELGQTAIKAYHGSPAKFEAFDLGKAGTTTDEGFLGKGLYFSTDPKVSEGYPNRYAVEVSPRSPLRIALPKWTADKRQVVREALGLPANATASDVTKAAVTSGHDSVVLDYSPLGYQHQEIVAFDPHIVSIKK